MDRFGDYDYERPCAWEDVKDALRERVADVRRATYLCIEDRSKQLYAQELSGLDANVKALEQQMAELKLRLEREEQTIPKVEALLQAVKLQEEDLQQIATNLPTHVPQLHVQQSDNGSQASDDIRQGRARDTNTRAADKAHSKQWTSHQAQHTRTGATALTTAPAPRWYITEAELGSVASYMRGRLTLEKVNTAVDELAGFADANMKLLAAAKAPATANKLPPTQRKRATELLHSVATRDDVRAHAWLLEPDLKDGLSIKLDKTGRSILTLLRHLGRLQEVAFI